MLASEISHIFTADILELLELYCSTPAVDNLRRVLGVMPKLGQTYIPTTIPRSVILRAADYETTYGDAYAADGAKTTRETIFCFHRGPRMAVTPAAMRVTHIYYIDAESILGTIEAYFLYRIPSSAPPHIRATNMTYVISELMGLSRATRLRYSAPYGNSDAYYRSVVGMTMRLRWCDFSESPCEYEDEVCAIATDPDNFEDKCKVYSLTDVGDDEQYEYTQRDIGGLLNYVRRAQNLNLAKHCLYYFAHRASLELLPRRDGEVICCNQAYHRFFAQDIHAAFTTGDRLILNEEEPWDNIRPRYDPITVYEYLDQLKEAVDACARCEHYIDYSKMCDAVNGYATRLRGTFLQTVGLRPGAQ